MSNEKTDYQGYLDAVVHCMTEQLGLPLDAVEYHLKADHEFIEDLFADEPEVLFHDDPIRLAKSLGVRWNMIKRKPLVVQRVH